MRNIKDEKGVTIAALAITLAVIIILFSIVGVTTISTIEFAQYHKAKSEMELVQAKVNLWYQEYFDLEVNFKNSTEYNEKITEIKNSAEYRNKSTADEKENYLNSQMELYISAKQETLAKKYGDNPNTEILRETLSNANLQIEDISTYRYLSSEYLKTILDIDTSNKFFVDIPTRTVILRDGIDYNDKTYYTTDDFDIATVNKENYEELQFELTQGEGNNIIISNLKFKENNTDVQDLSKFQVKYRKKEGTNQKYIDATNNILKYTDETDKKIKYKFNVPEEGVYQILIKTTDDKTQGNREITVIQKPNAPELKHGMIPITYKSELGNWVVADKTNKNNDWYDYENKKWANICTVNNANSDLRNANVGTIITEDKMTTMFVWIPRYAYSIVNGFQTSNTQTPSATNTESNKKIEIKFLVGKTNIDINNNMYPTDYNINEDVVNGKTPMIVHPAFKYGDEQITGFWMAKFEASGTKIETINGIETTVAVGNASSSSSTQQYEPESDKKKGKFTYVKVLPSAISWRHITIGESQYRCTEMSSDTSAYGWKNVNTHLTKNSEWGAVAYLCYSKYGQVPMINGYGNKATNEDYYYNLYTGMGPKTDSSEERYDSSDKSEHEYNTQKGMLASSTGNIYGVYDMSGGSIDMVASYLDNKNNNLNKYGKIFIQQNNSNNQDNSSEQDIIDVKYFENGILNKEYLSLWEGYEVSTEEKNNSIQVEGENTNLTQDGLWNKSGVGYNNASQNEKYNTARKRLTDAIYTSMTRKKGIGINEVAGSYSYYGVINSDNIGIYKPLINTSDTNDNKGRTWNNDTVLIGNLASVFMTRGSRIRRWHRCRGTFYK